MNLLVTMCAHNFNLVLKFAVILELFLIIQGSHVITTPRKWPYGGLSKVCVSLTEDPLPEDLITIAAKANAKNLITPITINLSKDRKSSCYNIIVPATTNSRVSLEVEGSIGGKKVKYRKPIGIINLEKNYKTFVQTDKYLYKPSQTVNIRMLTIRGPLLKMDTETYPEIWIENPSGTRLKQWIETKNTAGLIHLSYKLSEEPMPGTYTIKVKTSYDEIYEREFKVEEYVLPRFEVVLTPPCYILEVSPSHTYKVCASYTFGQPVKGTVLLKVRRGGKHCTEIVRTDNITGCGSFTLFKNDFNDSPRCNHEKLVAIADVTEDGTGTTLSSDELTTKISRTAITFEDISIQSGNSRPGLPYLAEVSAKFPDGSPAAGELMSVCSGSSCKDISTNSNGHLKFALRSHENEFKIESKNESYGGLRYLINYSTKLEKYHSPSSSSVVIGLFKRQLDCHPGETIKFDLPVLYSSTNSERVLITAQVISRGQIIYTDSKQHLLSNSGTMPINEDLYLSPSDKSLTKGQVRGSFTFSVELPQTASPKVKILVWFAREDQEVVSDFRDIDVTACLVNDVALSWSSSLSRPGDEESIQITAKPYSLCSLGVVDQSVQLLSPSGNDITVGKLLEHTNVFDVDAKDLNQIDDNLYCRNKGKRIIEPPPPNYPEARRPNFPGRRSPWPIWPRPHHSRFRSHGIDAMHMFNDAGVYVMSDLDLEFRECEKLLDVYRPYLYFSPGIRRRGGAHDERTSFSAVPGRPAAPRPKFEEKTHEIATIPEAKEKKPRTHFPETWLWDLVDVKSSGTFSRNLTMPDTVTEWVGKAVCVNPTLGVGVSKPSSITTFRDFFVDLTLPPTAKRGEIIPVKISVFNYLKTPLPVLVSMLPSYEYEIITDESSKLGSGDRSSCIGSQDKDVYTIRIRPNVVGDVNITIDAAVDLNSLSTCGSGSAEERRDIIIKPIRVDYEGFPREKTWSDYMCATEMKDANVNFSMVVPPAIVDMSARGFVSVVGDLMGPSIDNLGHLVRLPSGCGEQNMIGFAPNIFVMQYLEASKQATKEIFDKAITNMESGYSRELNYRHDDGSYSAFGKRDGSGSTWLTAFVLKCFGQAVPFISIDQKDFDKSGDWLNSIQGEDGCFKSVGKVLHKGMKGGISNSQSTSSLTSFVLISLLESGFAHPNDSTVVNATECIKRDPTTASYALALKAYALVLAKDIDATEAVNELLSKAIITATTIEWGSDGELQKSDAIALETAGYAILALLTFSPETYRDEASKTIKAMNSKRNGQGGFISTQDTVVALQAMAAYEQDLPQGPIDLDFIIINEMHEAVLSVNERNKLLLQREFIPSFPAVVNVVGVGTGCALVQAVLRYNVPNPDSSEAFTLRVETSTEPDNGCKTKRISVCASYRLPDLKSNMAIIEVDVVTGYIPDKKDLKLVVSGGAGTFKRYEVDGSKVLFYVDEFSSEEICTTFKVLREFDVEDAKDGTVSVYDYYSPEYAISESYKIPPSTECATEEAVVESV